MADDLFVAYFVDALSSSEPLFAIKQGNQRPRLATFDELSRMNGRVFTLQADRLVDTLRLKGLSIGSLVDLRHALQLASGLPKKEFETSEWRISKWLALTALTPPEQKAYLALLNGEGIGEGGFVLLSLLLKASEAIADIWLGIAEELKRLGEFERFIEFEIPVQRLMYKRQELGLGVDLVASRELLEAAKSEKYEAMLRVGAALKVNPTGLKYRTVVPFLSRTDAANLEEFGRSRNLPSYFKLASNESRFANDFRAMMQADRNIRSLLSFAASKGRVYPYFDTMGTVTARIQTLMPNVQHLKRSYRRALVADPETHSVYLDYAQCEPGVLAQLVGPGRYRDLYNEGDLYSLLSEAVFGDRGRRELAKQIFIAFCYGMQLDSIGILLGGSSAATKGPSYAKQVGDFFGQFPELEAFRRRCEEDLHVSGCTETIVGNRRIRRGNGGLTRKERGWAMNQVVQGSASLIFKGALLALDRTFGAESILLPLHDAVWLQISQAESDAAEFQHIAVSVMENAFRRWCPDVRIKVKAGSFNSA